MLETIELLDIFVETVISVNIYVFQDSSINKFKRSFATI